MENNGIERDNGNDSTENANTQLTQKCKCRREREHSEKKLAMRKNQLQQQHRVKNEHTAEKATVYDLCKVSKNSQLAYKNHSGRFSQTIFMCKTFSLKKRVECANDGFA